MTSASSHGVAWPQRALLVLLLSLMALGCAAQTSIAATTQITEGELKWGLRDSFRQYISIGGGTISVSGGAQLCNSATCVGVDGSGAGDFVNFEAVDGEFDDETNTLRLSFDGTVRFQWTAHLLDIKISNLKLFLSDGFSVIRADVESVENCIGPDGPLDAGGQPCPVNTWNNVALAELNLAGKAPSVSGSPAIESTWTNVPTILAPAGAVAFGDMYAVGEAFDPATFHYVGPGGIPRLGAAPAGLNITSQPSSQSLVVDSSVSVREVNLSAAASGTETFSVNWQKRRLGEPWSDVVGADSEELRLALSSVDSGTLYRAIYETGTGKLSTNAAIVTIAVNDTVPPAIIISSPANGSSTIATSVPVHYTAIDNEDPSPNCTIASGVDVPLLHVGVNTVTVVCVDAANNIGSASAKVTRLMPPAPSPGAPSIRSLKKTFRLKGGNRKLSLAKITCKSPATCVYSLPKSVTVKVGRKSFKVKLSASKRIETGRSSTIRASLPTGLVRALKGRRAKLKLTVQVANTDGVRFPKSASTTLILRG